MAAIAARLAWRQQAPMSSCPSPTTTVTHQFLPLYRSSPFRSATRPRRPLNNHQSSHRQQQRHQQRSYKSTAESKEPPQSKLPPSELSAKDAAAAAKEARRRATAERITNRSLRFMPNFLAKRLRGPLENMIKSPGSHVVSFLIIHEITAILPLFGFMSLFVYMDWVPTAWVAGPWAAWALEGVRKYAGYFRKKGWFGMGGAENKDGEKKLEAELEEEVQHEKIEHDAGKDAAKGGWFGLGGKKASVPIGDATTAIEAHREEEEEEEEEESKKAGTASKVATTTWHAVKKVVTFDNIDTGYKTSIQFAAAYAITKMLLPARLALSIMLTPTGARAFTGIWRFVRGKPTVR